MTILTILLALFFTFASSIKILGWQKFIFETQLAFFKKYRLNRVQMLWVGLAELAAACLLMISIYLSNELLNGVGSVMIALISMGAIYFHLRFDTLKDAIAAIVTLVLSTTLTMSNQTLQTLIF
jgi:hypothetical protein